MGAIEGDALKEGRVTSRQLVEQYFARIVAYDPQGPAINAFITLNRKALDEADVLDAERRAGKLRGLAVTTPKRIATMPDLPAVAEVLPGFEVVGWYGVIGPAGLPAPIVTRLETLRRKSRVLLKTKT